MLMTHPDLLLLDEPTNHLDANTVNWLEQHLAAYQGTMILITHDRYFLDNVVNWMLEIERCERDPVSGQLLCLPGDEGFAAQRRKEARSSAPAQAQVRARVDPDQPEGDARPRTRPRLRRYEDLRSEQEGNGRGRQIELQIPPGPKLGNKVLEVRGLSKGYGEKRLIEDLSFEIPPGGILGVIGENGAGKTTLMKMILGKEEPDAGEIEIGQTVELCYLDQSRLVLDDDKTVFQEITDELDEIPFGQGFIAEPRAYLARFNFRGEDQQKKVGNLSGGQRNRVQLAKMLRDGGNLLILDEPTNDLDIPTLQVLEEALNALPGLRDHRLARSLLPEPDGDPHPRARGRRQLAVLSRRLRHVSRAPGPRGRRGLRQEGHAPAAHVMGLCDRKARGH